ncbi:MAG: hypothetical protein LBS74_07030 [Oscillospiraceae bacterium]|jgi:hypothetical protein|nr:hypothetical protein [Oscillospiraceae bacterium]
MNFLFISPNHPSVNTQLACALSRAGANVLGIGDAGLESLTPELRDSLAAYYYVKDLHDYESVYRAVAHYISHYGKIERLESFIPYWYPLEEQLRHDYRINGRKHSKPLSLAEAKAADIAVPEHRAISSSRQGGAFAKKHGYPAYIRYCSLWQPDVTIEKSSALKPVDFAQKPEIFTLPKGDFLCVDGFRTAKDSNIFTVYYSLAEDSTPQKQQYFYTYSGKLPSEKLINDILRLYNISNSFFHIELLVQGEKFLLLKAGEALPFEFPLEAISLDTGRNAYDIWASLQTGGRAPKSSPLQSSNQSMILCTGRDFNRSYAHSHSEVLAELGGRLLSHRLSKSGFKTDYIYYFKSDSLKEANELINYINIDFGVDEFEQA